MAWYGMHEWHGMVWYGMQHGMGDFVQSMHTCLEMCINGNDERHQ